MNFADHSRGHTITLLFLLSFLCTNSVAEFKAFLSRLVTAQAMGIKNSKIRDSKLVISQVNGDFVVKKPSLAPYRALAQSLIVTFQEIRMEHLPGSTNCYTDALATLGSNLIFKGDEMSV